MKLMRLHQPSVVSWSPFDQLATMRDEINRLFDSSFGEFVRTPDLFGGWTPALDLYEDKDNLIVRAELPGLKKDDIEISLNQGTLAISGERKAEARSEGTDVHREERFYGRFQRTLDLPKPVQAERVAASYKDGILTVTLPKTEEAKPKQIEVTVD
jgi:HSP20 family protein